jgi:chromosome segregation ATPase
VQKGYREKLQKSSEELSRLLQEAEKECEELSKKLETTCNQTQDLTSQVESLETKVKDKKENTEAQVEQLKEQLSVHLQQRNEWRENTMQMKDELKKKTDLCARLTAKLGMLKKMKNNENPKSSVLSNGNKADITEGQTEDVTTKMATLEKELKVQHKENLDVDRILKEKEEQCSNINSKLEALSSELMNL